jgi:hypothetical protein
MKAKVGDCKPRGNESESRQAGNHNQPQLAQPTREYRLSTQRSPMNMAMNKEKDQVLFGSNRLVMFHALKSAGC